MLTRLVESGRRVSRGRVAAFGTVSLVMHAAVIVAAVVATATASPSRERPVVDTAMVFLPALPRDVAKPQPRPVVVTLETPLKGFQTVVAPTDIPNEIPPVNLAERFNPQDYSGIGVEGGVAGGVEPGVEHVYALNVVTEQPALLSGPVPAYPPLLEHAGIQGRVVLEAVVDTLGRVEPASIRLISSPNPLFNEPAVGALRRSVFRPARVSGRAVRVLVRIPYEFVIK